MTSKALDVVATCLSFTGVVPEHAQHQCSVRLDEVRKRVVGLYVSAGPSDCGEQHIAVLGSAADADELEALLTKNGLKCVSRRLCPEFALADGQPNLPAISARLSVHLDQPVEYKVDFPSSDDRPLRLDCWGLPERAIPEKV